MTSSHVEVHDKSLLLVFKTLYAIFLSKDYDAVTLLTELYISEQEHRESNNRQSVFRSDDQRCLSAYGEK